MLSAPQRTHFFDPTPRSDEVMKTKQIGQYLLTSHCLGSGSFATVHLGMDSGHPSYKQVACKIIKKKKNQRMDKMMKEVRILTALNHVCLETPYVLNLTFSSGDYQQGLRRSQRRDISVS